MTHNIKHLVLPVVLGVTRYCPIMILIWRRVLSDARVMVVGCRGTVTLNPRFLMLPEASIRGVALGNSTPADYREMGSAIVAGIEAGWVDPVINREYRMDEVQQVGSA